MTADSTTEVDVGIDMVVAIVLFFLLHYELSFYGMDYA